MNTVNDSILVSVDLSQRDNSKIGDTLMLTGRKYNENFRERNPVIAYVDKSAKDIPTGSHIVCNYSFFDLESPLEITDGTYSVPISEEIFAIVNDDGLLTPVQGNVLVERVTKDSKVELPEELKKPHMDRGILLTPTDNIKSGKFIFWLKMADYEICYTWKGEERRALKIHQSEIVGYLK